MRLGRRVKVEAHRRELKQRTSRLVTTVAPERNRTVELMWERCHLPPFILLSLRTRGSHLRIFYSSFIEILFTWYKGFSFKVCTLVFRLLTELCNHHQYLNSRRLSSLQKEVQYPLIGIPYSLCSQALVTTNLLLSLWSCLFGHFRWMESCNMRPSTSSFFHLNVSVMCSVTIQVQPATVFLSMTGKQPFQVPVFSLLGLSPYF